MGKRVDKKKEGEDRREWTDSPIHIGFVIDKKLNKLTTRILKFYSKLFRKFTGYKAPTVNSNERRLLASLINKKGYRNVLIAMANMLIKLRKKEKPFTGRNRIRPNIANFILYYEEFRNADEFVEFNLNEIFNQYKQEE